MSAEAINWTAAGLLVLVLMVIISWQAWRIGTMVHDIVRQRVRLAWAHSLLVSALRQLPPGKLAEEIQQFTSYAANAETIERKVEK